MTVPGLVYGMPKGVDSVCVVLSSIGSFYTHTIHVHRKTLETPTASLLNLLANR